ncbi:MAG: hypothetical protein EOL97_00420 [Spirochaetia bacterium]|nr:hypothetical protein [Spirochaetia bacterium]
MNNYNCIAIDEGCQTILNLNTETKKIKWKTSLENYPTARALQKISNNRVLVGFDGGYFEINIDNGKIEHCCNERKNVTSAIRENNGNTILTGLDLDNNHGICVTTLDNNDKVIKTISKEGDYVRLMSITNKNTYLLSTNSSITETDQNLNTIKTFEADGFLHAWQSLRLDDERTIVSSGYGAYMAIFDKFGKLEKTFGEKENLPKEIEPFFYASFRLTKDNTILVANWEGHGPNNSHKGKQLLQFSLDGKYIDSISFENDISSFQGLLILD